MLERQPSKFAPPRAVWPFRLSGADLLTPPPPGWLGAGLLTPPPPRWLGAGLLTPPPPRWLGAGLLTPPPPRPKVSLLGAHAMRRGSLLAEVGIATLVLVIVMGFTMKTLSTVGHERRAAEQRQRGVLEVGNLMERITALPFDKVTAPVARGMSLSDVARASLRDAELAIDVSAGDKSAEAGRSAKRVMIRLRWRGPSGEWQAPVRLTSWIESRRNRS